MLTDLLIKWFYEVEENLLENWRLFKCGFMEEYEHFITLRGNCAAYFITGISKANDENIHRCFLHAA